jgi:hypothetical protein
MTYLNDDAWLPTNSLVFSYYILTRLLPHATRMKSCMMHHTSHAPNMHA